MKEYSIFDKEFLNSSLYQEFKKINAGYGNLKIRAYAAREALPLEGVHIIISTVYYNTSYLYYKKTFLWSSWKNNMHNYYCFMYY